MATYRSGAGLFRRMGNRELLAAWLAHMVGCKSVSDVVESVGETPVSRYSRPYQMGEDGLLARSGSDVLDGRYQLLTGSRTEGCR